MTGLTSCLYYHNFKFNHRTFFASHFALSKQLFYVESVLKRYTSMHTFYIVPFSFSIKMTIQNLIAIVIIIQWKQIQSCSWETLTKNLKRSPFMATHNQPLGILNWSTKHDLTLFLSLCNDALHWLYCKHLPGEIIIAAE